MDNLPGDRSCECHGIIEPIGIDFIGGEAEKIVFRCTKCGKLSRNKIASDDHREVLLELAGKPTPDF